MMPDYTTPSFITEALCLITYVQLLYQLLQLK